MVYRMFVVGHSVTSNDNFLEMKFDMVGTTGNIYKTTIGKIPECDCPDARKGHQCKHICYGMCSENPSVLLFLTRRSSSSHRSESAGEFTISISVSINGEYKSNAQT